MCTFNRCVAATVWSPPQLPVAQSFLSMDIHCAAKPLDTAAATLTMHCCTLALLLLHVAYLVRLACTRRTLLLGLLLCLLLLRVSG